MKVWMWTWRVVCLCKDAFRHGLTSRQSPEISRKCLYARMLMSKSVAANILRSFFASPLVKTLENVLNWQRCQLGKKTRFERVWWWGPTSVFMCCKQKHMITSAEFIHYAPPLTWTLQRFSRFSERVWQDNLPQCCSYVKDKLQRKSAPHCVVIFKHS